MKIQGVDISKWQGNWDATVAKEAGSAFVFIKASQSKYTDPYFISNWQKASEAELMIGAYHYLDYSISGAEQADYFADIVDTYQCNLPPIVDFEKHIPNHGHWPVEFLRDFVTRMIYRGYTPIVYTSSDFWLNFGEKDEYWAQFPLWLAQDMEEEPQVPPPWKTWTFWQYANNGPGKKFGAESFEIALDYFNGSLEDLFDFAGIEFPNDDIEKNEQSVEQRLRFLEKTITRLSDQIIKLEGESKNLNVVCNTKLLNVRKGPGLFYPLAGELVHGELAKVLERKNGWAYLDNPSGWAKEKYLAYAAHI